MSRSHIYARAIFEIANNKDIATWSNMFDIVARLFADTQFKSLIIDPKFDTVTISNIIVAIVNDLYQKYFNQPLPIKQFLLRLLVMLRKQDSYFILPDIIDAFRQLRLNHGGALDAIIESAVALTPQQLNICTNRLSARFNKIVNANNIVNHNLIGGIKININGQVLDLSIKHQLNIIR